MYEASFGLKRRPFAATPDASCFLSAAPIQAALDELVICVEQGQGISVLTAPAGTGKTLLCERLRYELGERYETVFLRHASFLTRRALLQTILCELNHQYHHPSEQELRLELFPAIRALQPKREALVLICDEAHQLTDSLLEELRILADFAEAGRPLVRLVLVGQLSLEEKLAQPGLDAFNQRIRAQINLSSFDHAQSLDYVDYRVTWAGGRTDEVFTPEALDLIVRASDGIPRCINQLADHTLLLAFVAEQQPASEELAREALSDLRQLPLHWNEPAEKLTSNPRSIQYFNDDETRSLSSATAQDPSGFLMDTTADSAMYSFEPESGPSSGLLEPSASSTDSIAKTSISRDPSYVSHDDVIGSSDNRFEGVEVGSDEWRKAIELFNPLKPELVDSLSGRLTDSVINSDEQSRSRLKRRIDFHNLIQEAYDAAGELLAPAKISNAEQSTGEPINRSGATSTNRTFDEDRLSNVSDAGAFVTRTTNVVYEELIVDRYSAIDAGLQPPELPPLDTTSISEVRAAQSPVDVFLEPIPESFNELAQNDRHDLIRPSILNDHSGYNVSGKGTNEPSITNIAEEVYSLGESLRPGDTLSSSSESILKALRNEVDGLSSSLNTEIVHQISSVTRTTTWDSIETPLPAQPEPEPRPLRYLFSKLRRKQQGLS